MKEGLSHSTDEKTDVKKVESINLGSIVALNSHPFGPNQTEVKIAAYNHLTPPLMVVIEKKKGASYSAETGEKEKNSYKCLFYATVAGTFEEHWFRWDQIKLIESIENAFFTERKDKNLSTLKKELVGKSATLTTVDFELQKKQVYSASSEGSQNLKERNLLDFLPPVGTIISVSLNEVYNKYHEKTGKRILYKNRILVKLRWFNNKTSKFSEQDVPLCSLMEIEPHTIKEFKKDQVYLFKKELPMEGNDHFKINIIPIRFHDIIFSHHYYDYRFKNLFTGEITSVEQKEIGSIIPVPPTLKDLFEIGFAESKDSPANYFKDEDEAEWKNKWFEIKYLARNGRYTQRIIYVNEVLKLEIEKSKEEKALKANCLLRGGAIRNFRLKGIIGYRKMPQEFNNVFVDAT